MLALNEQSPNIASGVHINKAIENIGAGDQVCFLKYLFYVHFLNFLF